ALRGSTRPTRRHAAGLTRRAIRTVLPHHPTISPPVGAPVDRGGWGAVTADEIWDQGAAALRAQLAPATWAAWFHGVRPVGLAEGVLMLSVPSSLAAERIRSSYSGLVTDA